ncbi:MAG: hypothetical protein IPG64_14590 [Haliea sp.]|nr:hypothetical protein [Haliea sp.]
MINRGATLVSRLAMLCAVLFALAACGGGGGGGGTFFDEDDDTPVNPPVTQNYTLALTLQDATGSAATSLAQSATGTLKILVTDDNNSAIPVAGALVSVQITAGAVSPTSGITDENDLLTLQITAGSELGAVEITASTSINDETYTGVLNYQVVEFVPYLLQLTLLGPDEQPTTALAKDTQGTLQAKVISADGSGEPIANVLVNAGTSIGSLVPANGQALTNSSGIASFAVVAGSTVGAGAITTTAQIGDITFNNALNFQVTDETQTVSYFLSLTLLDSDDQPTNSLTKDKQGTLQAKVTSGSINGTPVPGVVVSANTNIGTLAPSNGRSLSDSNGVATFVVSAGSIIGAGTLSATLQIGDVTLNRSLNFQIADGVISITPYFVELTLLGPDGRLPRHWPKTRKAHYEQKSPQGSENGTPVANELVSASATVGSLASGQALSNSSGFANFTGVAGTTIAAGSATATIQIGGNTYTDSVNYEVVDNIPYTLELTLLGPDGQPTTTLAKNTQGTVQAKVTSTDGSNTPAVGVVVNTSSTVGILVPNGPALSDSNGVATYTIAAGSTIAAGTLTASVQIGGATFADTLNFEVVNAISYSLELTLLGPDGQPTTTLAKNTQGTLQAKVTANDGSNTPVVGALVNASTTVGSLVPASQALSDGNGVATFAVVAGSTIAAGAVTASVEIDGDTFSDTLNFEVINPILYSLELTLLGPDGQPTTKLSKNTQGTLQAKSRPPTAVTHPWSACWLTPAPPSAFSCPAMGNPSATAPASQRSPLQPDQSSLLARSPPMSKSMVIRSRTPSISRLSIAFRISSN